MDPSLTGSWRPTASLARSVATATTVLFVGVALGRPELLVLAAPFGLAAALAVAHAPRCTGAESGAGGEPLAPRGTEHPSRGLLRVRGRARAGDRGDLAGGVRRDAAGLGCVLGHGPRGPGGPAGLRRQPATLGAAPHRPDRGGRDDAVGRLPLGAAARPRAHPDRASRDRGVPVRGDPAPGRPDRPEPLPSRRSRLGVLRDPAVPAGRSAAPRELAHDAAHRRAALGRHQRPGGQRRADPGRRGHRRRGQRWRRRTGQHPRRDRPRSGCAGRPPRPRGRPGRACGSSAAPVRCSDRGRDSDTCAGCRSSSRRCSPDGPRRSALGDCACASAPGASSWSSPRC